VKKAEPKATKPVWEYGIIIRSKQGKNRMAPLYLLYAQAKDGSLSLLYAAKKQTMNKTPNYHIFDMRDAHPHIKLSKDSTRYMGKLRGDKTSTEYTLYSAGLAPREAGDGSSGTETRAELAAYRFAGGGGASSKRGLFKKEVKPRDLTVLQPVQAEDGVPGEWRTGRKDSTLLAQLKSSYVMPETETLVTKAPELVRGTYQLNFRGRVKAASVKNFQLCAKGDAKHAEVMQFGRVEDDRFVLDVQPSHISRMVAFGAALAHFDT
jgi:tubby-related protein 1